MLLFSDMRSIVRAQDVSYHTVEAVSTEWDRREVRNVGVHPELRRKRGTRAPLIISNAFKERITQPLIVEVQTNIRALHHMWEEV